MAGLPHSWWCWEAWPQTHFWRWLSGKQAEEPVDPTTSLYKNVFSLTPVLKYLGLATFRQLKSVPYFISMVNTRRDPIFFELLYGNHNHGHQKKKKNTRNLPLSTRVRSGWKTRCSLPLKLTGLWWEILFCPPTPTKEKFRSDVFLPFFPKAFHHPFFFTWTSSYPEAACQPHLPSLA